MLHIGADQLRGAGEVLVDLFAEELSQQRQRPVAHPGAKQRLVSVHGVVPPRQVVQAADLLGVDVAKGGALVPAGAQEGAQDRPARAGDAGQGAGTCAARQPHQHLLGLVVERVSEQQSQPTALLEPAVQSLVTSRTGSVLHPAGGRAGDLHADHVRGRAHLLGLGPGPFGDLHGALLQTVVDDHRLRLQTHPRAHPAGGGQQRQGVRSPAEADQQPRRQPSGGRVIGQRLEPGGQRGPHGGAGAGDHGWGAGHHESSASSEATASTAARASSASTPSNPWTTIEEPTVRPSGITATPARVAAPPRYPVLPRTRPRAGAVSSVSKRSTRGPERPAMGTSNRICSRRGASPEETWASTAASSAGGTRLSGEGPEPSRTSRSSSASSGKPSSAASSRTSASTAAAAPRGVVSSPRDSATR